MRSHTRIQDRGGVRSLLSTSLASQHSGYRIPGFRIGVGVRSHYLFAKPAMAMKRVWFGSLGGLLRI